MSPRRTAAAAVASLVAGLGGVVAVASPAEAAQCEPGKVQYVAQEPLALRRLNARFAWTQATGRGVVVAVVDSGVDARNAHFKDALVVGKSFVPQLPANRDDLGHGTAVAGEIVARGVKGSGLVGLAPEAKVMPVRVFFSDAEESRSAGVGPRPDRIAAGIRYAADHGAKVVNVSMSTPTDDPALREAVSYATRRGALVVASAGNRNVSEDKSDSPRYPAAYPEAVAVAAVDASDTVGEGSIHGPHVDLAAPGTQILTTYLDAGDCLLEQDEESTSFATAYVSAAAALLAQRFPTEGPAAWKHRLESTAARDRRDQRTDAAGWGLVQPYEALTALTDSSVEGPPAPGESPRPVVTAAPERIDLSARPDPYAPQRTAALWWSLLGAGALVALALGGAMRTGRARRRAA
ncbi:S8 family serine peptidase [Pedococcus sp. NPDC057267]|uniref:S8 family serine peptidase n=1 Tax=Pedococcus sp. NPDC057267 TaxID=3346077 RepID=UPI00363C2F0E